MLVSVSGLLYADVAERIAGLIKADATFIVKLSLAYIYM